MEEAKTMELRAGLFNEDLPRETAVQRMVQICAHVNLVPGLVEAIPSFAPIATTATLKQLFEEAVKWCQNKREVAKKLSASGAGAQYVLGEKTFTVKNHTGVAYDLIHPYFFANPLQG